MTALIHIPTLDPDNLGCDLCSAYPVVVNLDGDRMCRTCADAWVRGQEQDADYYGHAPDEDEVADLRRTLRTACPARAALIEAHLCRWGVGL